jgi:hypothetical protein
MMKTPWIIAIENIKGAAAAGVWKPRYHNYGNCKYCGRLFARANTGKIREFCMPLHGANYRNLMKRLDKTNAKASK